MLTEYIQNKLRIKGFTLLLSALLCGLAMGFVTTFAIVLGTMTGNPVLSKLIYSVAFTALLLLVVLNGYDLFTGNTMLLIAVNQKDKTKRILKNLLAVYLGNLIGCIIAAGIVWLIGIHQTFNLNQMLLSMYTLKTQLPIYKMLLLGLLANYFVCMGVYLSFKAKTITEKYLSLFFPICIFCVLGFEHSVANMYSLFYAFFVGGGNFGGLILNLALVSIGNIVGGVLFAISIKIKDKISKPTTDKT